MNKIVNPSRMELMNLRKKFDNTKRGHKLLKDKQDEIIRNFINIISDYKELRNEVETKIEKVLNYYKLSLVKMNENDVLKQLENFKINTSLLFYTTKIMGIDIPLIKVAEKEDSTNSYNYLKTTAAFDELINYSKTLLPKLIELLELEAKVERMIIEIEKSKRRVNAIENIVLKELDEQIRVIKAKLSDIERSNTIRIMKSKELIIEKDKK